MPLDHTHWTCTEMQSAKQAGLQTHLFHSSPVAPKAGRQKQEHQTRSRTMKTTTGTRHALPTALLCMPMAVVGVSKSTRLLKDWINCWRIDSNKVESVNIEWNVMQIELIYITIESILSTIESVYHNWVDFCHNRVDLYHNRVGLSQLSRFLPQSSQFLSQSSRFLSQSSQFWSCAQHNFWIDNYETNSLPYILWPHQWWI